MKKVETFLIFLLSFLVLASLVVFLTPSLKTVVQSWIFTGERHVLAKIEGSFAIDPIKPQSQSQLTVVKIRENQDLLIEIFRTTDGETALWGSFRFENETDGYLTQGDQSTNLSLTDTNRDGIFRIVVPAVDSKMNPRIHLLEYSSKIDGFIILRENEAMFENGN